MNNGLDFQEKVFNLVSNKLKDNWPGATFSISDFNQGPIDIVAMVRRSEEGLALAGETAYEIEENIFLECKDHATKLGLDVTGKAYCVALAEQPSYLIIVSRRGLQPQALQFAARLFRCRHITNLVLDKHGHVIQKPLSAVNFLHYTLDELEGATHLPNSKTLCENLANELTPLFKVAFWKLKEELAAYTVIANNETPVENVVTLRSNENYLLEFLLEIKHASFDFEQLEINISIGNSSPIRPSNAQTDLKNFLSLEFSLEKSHISFLSKERSLLLNIEGKNGPSNICISLPKMENSETITIFPNLRPELEADLINKMQPGGGSHCLIVEGHAGVGKSYLGVNICEYLASKYGFKQKSIRLTRRESSVFIIQLAIALFDFSETISSDKNNNYGYKFITSYLGRFIEVDDFTRCAGDNLEELPIDVLVSLCTSNLSNISGPHIILFQNCQDALPETLYALNKFCDEVTKENWKNLRFIFEYRSDTTATKSWNEFKKSRSTDYVSGSNFINIDPLSSLQLRQAVSPLFPSSLVHEVALSLYKKTGGNPLYMDHILRYFINRGYTQLLQKNGECNRFRVLDIGGIRNELTDINESVTEFLKRRLFGLIDTYESSSRGNNKTVLRDLLWLHTLSPHPPSRKQMELALKVNSYNINSAVRYLVSESVLTDRSLNGDISFIHELVSLAAKSILPLSDEISFITDRLAQHSYKNNAKDCLNLGAAMLSANRLYDAEEWLQLGIENAVTESNYYYQRLIFNQLDDVLENQEQETLQDKIKWIDVKMGLGWAELQAGSLIDAKQAYLEAEKLCMWPFDSSDPAACRIEKNYRFKALHRLATVDIELFKIPQGLKSIQNILARASDTNLLFHTSNRLLLSLMHANQPDIGAAVAPYCLGLSEKCTDTDSLSVIMSDLGSLYFSENPMLSSKLWNIGVGASVDRRQKTHSLANKLVAELVLTESLSEASCNSLEKEILSLKLEGQLSRLELIRGASAFISKDFELAEKWFSISLKRSITHNQTLMRWLATYNLSISRIALGEYNNSYKDLNLLDEELESINKDYKEIHSSSILNKKLIEQACNRGSIKPIYEYDGITLPQSIETTGPLYSLVSLTKHTKTKKLITQNLKKTISTGHIIRSDNYPCIVY